MENESIAIWNCITVEVGHKKQDAADYLLYGSSFIFRYHGRDFYFYHAGIKRYLSSRYDSDGGIHGRINWFTAVLVEIYGSGMKKVYKANGIPVYFGLLTTTFSAMIHLLLMSVMIYAIAPFAFGAKLPNQSVFYFISLIIFIMISLSVGSILGLVMKKQAKVTMISQLVFLPSIMLSGIMFPIDFLPDVLRWIGMIFPAAWGYQLMLDYGFGFQNLWPMVLIFVIAVVTILLVLRKIKTDET